MPKIDFILNRLPEKAFNKNIESNLHKILSTLSEELDIFVSEMDKVKNSRFVDDANGEDLDKLGKIVSVYRFTGESDQSYRGRIKSKVPSFIGGGTLEAIRQVIKNFLGVTPTIIEHYNPGDEHVYFDKGVFNGLDVIFIEGLTSEIKSGIYYINGTRVTLDDTQVILPNDSISYIKLLSDGNYIIDNNNSLLENQILLAEVTTSGGLIQNITDMRNILDPYEHFITNTSTITIQIPYNFTESLITLNDVKNIIRQTKASGIAVLINTVGAYKENTIEVRDSISFNFLVGLSGIGSANFIGGQ